MVGFNLGDVFIIGFFTTMIGLRKYPIAKLDEMIDAKIIDTAKMKVVIGYFSITLIGGVITAVIIANNLFNNIGTRQVSNYEVLQAIVTVILSAIWYFMALRPIAKRVNIISGGK